MPALESIAIKGFKSIRDSEVKLRDINVLIGANGSGKSNLIEVFSFLQAIHANRPGDGFVGVALRQYVARAGGAGRLLHFGPRFTEDIDVRIQFEDPIEQYRISMTYTDDDSLRINVITADYSLAPSRELPLEVQLSKEANTADIGPREEKLHDDGYVQLVSSWRLYHFHDTSRSAPIKKTAALHDNRYLRRRRL